MVWNMSVKANMPITNGLCVPIYPVWRCSKRCLEWETDCSRPCIDLVLSCLVRTHAWNMLTKAHSNSHCVSAAPFPSATRTRVKQVRVKISWARPLIFYMCYKPSGLSRSVLRTLQSMGPHTCRFYGLPVWLLYRHRAWIKPLLLLAFTSYSISWDSLLLKVHYILSGRGKERLFSRHISRTQSFQEKCLIPFQARVVVKTSVSLTGRLVPCSVRIAADRQTDTHTHTEWLP